MSFPLSFSKVEAIPLSRDPARILVRWDLAPNRVDMRDFEFYIDRGDAPDQLPAFQHVTIDGKPISDGTASTESVNAYQISTAISAIDFYQFLDYTPLLRNLFKQYYYRVRCRRISTQEEIASKAFTWAPDLDLVGLYVAEETNFLLEDTVGVPCLVHMKKRGGVPCRSCFDPIQKKRTSSSCTNCYGTNWEGGYYKPIDCYVDLSPDINQSSIAEWGEVQDSQKDILLSNYPEISTGDLIRELTQNRLYRVVKAKQTEKRRAPMIQFARVVEVTPGDVEYKLPFDAEFALSKLGEFEKIRYRREF